MAWNEPGNKGDKDPWGGRGDNQGPPDLDQLLKNLQKKFGGIFGGSGSGSGSGGGRGSNPDMIPKVVGIAAAVFIGIWAFYGLYTVEEGKQAVVLQFGQYRETTGPGLHWYPPIIQTIDVVDVSRINNAELSARATRSGEGGTLMLTQDENIVDIEMTVQYKVKDAKDYLFNVADPDVTLRQAMESALREIIGKSTMDFVITEGRGEIGQRAEDMVQQILDRYKTGLLVTSVNLQGAKAPEQVRSAFEDAVKAREDEQRLKNEAEAYSNDILPKARGAAARQLEDANAYKSRVVAHAEGEAARFGKILGEYDKAPGVTRERLYIEAVETVLGSTSKIMVDVPGGNNMVYLPLDKFLETTRGSSISSSSSSAASIPEPMSSPAESPATRSAASEQRERSRSREAR